MLISTKQPIIQTDHAGNVIRIQYNEVFRTPSTVPFEHFEAWYNAYTVFNDMIHGPEFEVEVPMGKGQMLILDNWRVLHGRAGGDRTAFDVDLMVCVKGSARKFPVTSLYKLPETHERSYLIHLPKSELELRTRSYISSPPVRSPAKPKARAARTA